MGHGVPGVDAQVQENLVQLRGVAEHDREFRGAFDHHLDVLGEAAPHHVLHFLDQPAWPDGDALALRTFGKT